MVYYFVRNNLILWLKGFRISEIKSIFRNRTRGESSVNLKLIYESLFGLIKLYLLKKLPKFNFLLFKPNFFNLIYQQYDMWVYFF